MLKLSFWRNFDFLIFLLAVVSALFGVLMIHSAIVYDTQLNEANLALKQLFGIGLGIGLFLAFARWDYHIFGSIQLPVYFITVVMLVVVEIVGITTLGSKRWITLPVVNIDFQPSEPAKVLVILMLARFYSSYETRLNRMPVFIFSLLQVAPIAALVFIEPDLGTTLVIMAIWLGMTISAGADRLHLLALLLIAVPIILGAWNLGEITGGKVAIFQQYQKDRLTLFLNPQQDPDGQGYNLIQSRKAVEGGGFTGQGYAQGLRNKGNYLKIRHADFIYSVIAEELGFAGSMLVLAVMGLLIMRILAVARMASDSYGRLICAGVGSMVFFQVFVNVGMNLGLMPVTGITLPLVSHGISSIVTVLIALGLVESVAMRHKRDKLWYYRSGPGKE